MWHLQSSLPVHSSRRRGAAELGLTAALILAAVAFAAVLLAGCSPSPPVSACPGQNQCVRFVSTPATGGNGAGDGGAATASDMAQSIAPDLAAAPADLSLRPDLSSGPDLAPMCQPTGGPCPGHNDAICCSQYCVYATNTCS